MVAGHSVLLRNNADVMDESAWHLLDYQREQSLPYAILEHIKAGILEAVRDPQSLLVFSGGETRGDGTAPYRGQQLLSSSRYIRSVGRGGQKNTYPNFCSNPKYY
mmetsp:Transcript_7901/g.11471  ORF Transcript_7901/g.11471 Transcript_7901/m.11471 type:complete len:105 (+) Transcript_7901:3264-3578(+)